MTAANWSSADVPLLPMHSLTSPPSVLKCDPGHGMHDVLKCDPGHVMYDVLKCDPGAPYDCVPRPLRCCWTVEPKVTCNKLACWRVETRDPLPCLSPQNPGMQVLSKCLRSDRQMSMWRTKRESHPCLQQRNMVTARSTENVHITNC